MATEGIDIVVTKSGADEAAASVAAIGDAGLKAQSGTDAANASIGFMKDTVAATVPPIQQMNSALAAQEGMLRAAQAAADRSGQTLDEYNAKTQAFINGTTQATAATEVATGATEKHEAATEKHTEATKSLGEATSFLKEAMTALGLAFTADKIIELTEAYQKTQIQLSSVSATTKDLAANQKALYDISQLTGSSFTANVNSFQKLAVETGNLGISQKDLLGVIQNVDAVVQESGGTAEQASQAVELFGRSLATGAVNGRQFRTLLLDFPQLGNLVAQGLNTSVSALVSTSAKTATSSKQFVEAFNNAASSAGVAGKEIELTLGGAIATLGNALVQYVGQAESANGFTQLLSNAIAGIARNFGAVATALEIGITLWASYYGVLVVIPGIFTLITSSVEALTVAIAANPLGFLLVALTTATALVYEFGNSISITSDGSITLLGAVIGVWNVLKNVIVNVYTYLSQTFGPYLTIFGQILVAPFTLFMDVVRGALTILSGFIPSLQPISAALNALANPLVTFKDIIVDSMTEATKQLNAGKDAATGLGAALGDGSPPALSTTAKNATSSINGLKNATQTWTDSMGLVHPVLTDLYDAQRLADQSAKDAAASLKAYDDEVDRAQEKIAALALQTQNAMGEMVTATDEWARRSGADFNAVAGASSSAAQAVASTQAAIDATTTTQASTSGGSGSSGGATGTSQGAISSGYNQFSNDINQLLRTGLKPAGISWNSLLQEANQTQDPNQRNALVSLVKADAHAVGAPGFQTGGDFMVGGAGGADSQLVQFYATPGEKVSVQTPAQQGSPGGRAIVVNMNVQTPDANSFRRSSNQTLLQLQSKLNGAVRGLS